MAVHRRGAVLKRKLDVVSCHLTTANRACLLAPVNLAQAHGVLDRSAVPIFRRKEKRPQLRYATVGLGYANPDTQGSVQDRLCRLTVGSRTRCDRLPSVL
eukprot:scaffold7454_cov53-Attheya_sp.AAC.1